MRASSRRRSDPPDPAAQARPRAGDRVHQRRRAGRGDADEHPPAQARSSRRTCGRRKKAPTGARGWGRGSEASVDARRRLRTHRRLRGDRRRPDDRAGGAATARSTGSVCRTSIRPASSRAMLDADRGGSFTLQPAVPFQTTRRYLPRTNVLETTFTTDGGVGPRRRRDDAAGRSPRSDARAGAVGRRDRRRACRCGGAARRGSTTAARRRAASGGTACRWRLWRGEARRRGQLGRRRRRRGTTARPRRRSRSAQAAQALLALTSAYGEPLILPGRAAGRSRDCRRRSSSGRRGRARTTTTVRGPTSSSRSALALKLMIFAPSGASVAAPTTSLPEEIGGERNWDYRFCWIRDSNFMIDALLRLGCHDEAQSLFWWFMQATALTVPELHVLYRLDGGIGTAERDDRLCRLSRLAAGARSATAPSSRRSSTSTARCSRPRGSTAKGITRSIRTPATVLARIADHVCNIWRQPDSGIWEVRNGPFHFTHSKVMCWVALDRAARLAERGRAAARGPPRAGGARRTRSAPTSRHDCWSRSCAATRASPAARDVDASLLMLPLVEYGRSARRSHPRHDRRRRSARCGTTTSSIAIMRDDGVPGGEGCFLELFVLAGQRAGALRPRRRRDGVDGAAGGARQRRRPVSPRRSIPHSGAFLGNFPQALVHLALIDAAMALARERPPRDCRRRSPAASSARWR